MWKDLKSHVPQHEIQKKDETDLRIELINGSIIALRGADNPDSLRGVGLDFLVIDEIQDVNPETWTAVLRPALADKNVAPYSVALPKDITGFMTCFLVRMSSPTGKLLDLEP